MAHYAELNDENKVVSVIVVSNYDEMENGQESEVKGVAFCQALTGRNHWKKTSYNGTIRKRYAGIGYTYSAEQDAFIAPQPFPSWNLDSETNWQPPVPMPIDGNIYAWDEAGQQWQEVTP